jgi:TonB family protein
LKPITRQLLLLAIFASSTGYCFAQANKSQDEPPLRSAAELSAASWQEYASAEGRFSILFPGTPKAEVQSVEIQGGQFQIHVHRLKAISEYGVIYADYPVPVDDPNVAKQVLDEGVKGAVAEVGAAILSVTEISLNGYPGRSFKEKLPNGSILKGKMYLVGRRMYQIAVTLPKPDATPDGGKADEQLADKFLDSFKLNTGREATGEAAGEVDRYLAQERVYGSKAEENSRAPISEQGVLQGRAISLPQPPFPPIARATRASGAVVVKIIVDEEGKVVAVQAVSGHPLLQAAAIRAAREAKFAPTLLDGKPVKIMGTLSYNFVPK